MHTLSAFDRLNERVSAGDRLTDTELVELARTPDILVAGMLADTVRRRLHGAQVTYLRVATRSCEQGVNETVASTAAEVRLTGAPGSLEIALAAVERAKAAAGGRVVSGFSWADVVRFSGLDGMPVGRVLSALRDAGLEALVELPLDLGDELAGAVDRLRAAGFAGLRLTVERAPAAERVSLALRAAALQDRHPCIRALNPLPTVLKPMRPTTGYEDVRAVAIARLAAPNIPNVQVDWMRYGPKLAQVALTFGADDLDAAPGGDEAPDGPRRAPIEELRRNVAAAGFSPAERDGRFTLVA